MRKTIILALSLMLMLPLAACGGTNAVDDSVGEKVETTITWNDTYPDALPILTQLLVGTLKLEGTDLAVKPELASELLPLWKVCRSLSTSDTAADDEVRAVVNQIQETMAPEQMAAIAAMKLAAADILALAQERGLEMRTSGAGGDTPGDRQGERLPGGAGQRPSVEEGATPRAERGASRNIRVPPTLFDALIELLETRAQK